MASSWMPSRVKDRGEAAGAALPADVVVGGGAVIGLVLGRDGEHAVLYIQIDVLLAEAGQVGLEQVVGALVPDISAEDRRAAAAPPNMLRSNSSNRSIMLLLLRRV